MCHDVLGARSSRSSRSAQALHNSAIHRIDLRRLVGDIAPREGIPKVEKQRLETVREMMDWRPLPFVEFTR